MPPKSARTVGPLAAALLALASPAAALACGPTAEAPAGASDAAYAVWSAPADKPVQAGSVAQVIWPGAGGPVGTASVAVGCRLRIAGVGPLPPFEVVVRPPDPVSGSEAAVAPGSRTFVMADTHGEYEIAVALLRNNGVLDEMLGWSYGRGTLVILGDVLDRGPNQTELLWLFYKLQAEAAQAGGRVQLLLGNHEVMILRGDLRYLNEKYPPVAEALGAPSYAEVLGRGTVLGDWLRTRPTILRIGDDLFMHGGLSHGFGEAGLDAEAVNGLVREAVEIRRREDLSDAARLTIGSDGPLWYRGYFAGDDEPPLETQAGVEATLARFGAQRVFVGHTVVDHVIELFEGRVVAVQVYPSRAEDGSPVMEAVEIDGERLVRAPAVGSPSVLNRIER